jgi:hypothetical protein
VRLSIYWRLTLILNRLSRSASLGLHLHGGAILVARSSATTQPGGKTVPLGADVVTLHIPYREFKLVALLKNSITRRRSVSLIRQADLRVSNIVSQGLYAETQYMETGGPPHRPRTSPRGFDPWEGLVSVRFSDREHVHLRMPSFQRVNELWFQSTHHQLPCMQIRLQECMAIEVLATAMDHSTLARLQTG